MVICTNLISPNVALFDFDFEPILVLSRPLKKEVSEINFVVLKKVWPIRFF